MPKGYWIGRVDVSDPEGYKAYVTANAEPFRKYGARFVVRGGTFEAKEGTSRSRNVVLEFPSYAAALACYESPEYQRAIALRTPYSDADIIVIEGYEGPQPSGLGDLGGGDLASFQRIVRPVVEGANAVSVEALLADLQDSP
jgi:uncharacterized protein (DUF1330 family)